MKNSLLVPVVFISNFILTVLAFSLSVGMWQYLMYGAGNGMLFFYSFLHCVYLILPIACIVSIFSVYVFIMRHSKKFKTSLLLLIITFALFFALVIPSVYSQGEKIDKALNAQEKILIDDTHLENFIQRPAFVKSSGDFLQPFLYDIYGQYKISYINYLIVAGAVFLLVFSFWVCTISTEWKIINFSFLPFLLILMLYAYSYIRSKDFILIVQDFVPFEISDFWIKPILFFSAAFLFFAYTAILLAIRHSKNTPKKIKLKPVKVKKQKIKTPKPIKTKKTKEEKTEQISLVIPEAFDDFSSTGGDFNA